MQGTIAAIAIIVVIFIAIHASSRRYRLETPGKNSPKSRTHRGTVRWFNQVKGYGFIRPLVPGRDVFVHITSVEKIGLRTLFEGDVVDYELVIKRGKSMAENLSLIERTHPDA